MTVVIACYNDALHLKQNFTQIAEIMDLTKYSYEVIFVDDRSPDNSREVIEDIMRENPSRALRKIYHEKNVGRGRSVTDGFLAARGRMMGFLDIDLEVHARYLPAVLLELEKGADLVLARRVFDLSHHSIVRFVVSKGYIRFSNRVLGTKGIDSETGFKFFRRDTMLDVVTQVEDNHWFWDTELVFRARRANKKIVEVPALFIKLPHKKSTVHLFRDTYLYILNLFHLKERAREGKL